MDKQKSYGQNYQPKKVRHRFSVSFVLKTFLACVAAAVVTTIFAKVMGL